MAHATTNILGCCTRLPEHPHRAQLRGFRLRGYCAHLKAGRKLYEAVAVHHWIRLEITFLAPCKMVDQTATHAKQAQASEGT